MRAYAISSRYAVGFKCCCRIFELKLARGSWEFAKLRELKLRSHRIMLS